MKDTTKHIIAKELFFFFKYLAIGIGISIILFIPAIIIGTNDIGPDWFERATGIISILPIFTPIWLYLYRFIKWLIEWINKWR